MRRARALGIFLLGCAFLSACFASAKENTRGPTPRMAAGEGGAAATGPRAGAAASGAVGPSTAGEAAGTGPAWRPLAACGADCVCDGGRFEGRWVCDEGAEPICACDDAMARSEACTPGASVTCTCPDGRRGTQVCTTDGLGFDACLCPA